MEVKSPTLPSQIRCLGCDASEICCSCQEVGLGCDVPVVPPLLPNKARQVLGRWGVLTLDPWRDMANQIRIPTDEHIGMTWHFRSLGQFDLTGYRPPVLGSFWNKNGWSLMSFYPEDQLLSHGFFFLDPKIHLFGNPKSIPRIQHKHRVVLKPVFDLTISELLNMSLQYSRVLKKHHPSKKGLKNDDLVDWWIPLTAKKQGENRNKDMHWISKTFCWKFEQKNTQTPKPILFGASKQWCLSYHPAEWKAPRRAPGGKWSKRAVWPLNQRWLFL